MVFFSIVSISYARWTEQPRHTPIIGPDGIPQTIINSLPPNTNVPELLALVCGVAVAGIGVTQRKFKLQFTGWQVFSGFATVSASAVLSIAIANNGWITGGIFYLGYLMLILGLVVVGVGLLQFNGLKQVAGRK